MQIIIDFLNIHARTILKYTYFTGPYQTKHKTKFGFVLFLYFTEITSQYNEKHDSLISSSFSLQSPKCMNC